MSGLKYYLLFLTIGLYACQHSTMDEYDSLVKKELSSNKKVNDIFWGINLGMTNKDFYVHCWNLNKKRDVQGWSGQYKCFT